MSNGARAAYLDVFKTLLVWGMITAHVIQLVGGRVKPPELANGFSDFINLVTFSGFLFAFGVGVGLSGRGSKSWLRRLRPAAMLLAASYISAIAFVTLVEKRPVTAELLTDLLSLRVLYGWSEFLASFFMLYLMLAVARPLFVRIAEKAWVLAATIAVCLAATLLTTSTNIPLTATIVANTNYANFPLLPYMPWFLLGIRLGLDRGAIRAWYVPVALVATGAFYWTSASTGAFPQRFPPSALWVIGPAAFLLAYVFLSKAIARVSVPGILLLPGRHVLMFLLWSNLIIFATRNRLGQPIHQLWLAALAAAGIVAAITVLAIAYEAWGKSRRGNEIAAGAAA